MKAHGRQGEIVQEFLIGGVEPSSQAGSRYPAPRPPESLHDLITLTLPVIEVDTLRCRHPVCSAIGICSSIQSNQNAIACATDLG